MYSTRWGLVLIMGYIYFVGLIFRDSGVFQEGAIQLGNYFQVRKYPTMDDTPFPKYAIVSK